AIYHLEKGDEPIISFGQGCEGEPLLASNTIKKAIEKIRMTTKKGIINMNTNAFSKDRLLSLREAGLDSIRISMISNIEETYNLYHNPCGYSLNDVRTAGRAAKSAGLFISLNLLTIPGLNDTPTELRAWEELLAEGWVDLVQIRNLNIDPDWLFAKIPLKEKGPGILHFIDAISKYTKVGNFSHYELKK
ncbi:MAG: radical SAM protein, partial [Bacillota bacterium]